MKSSLWTVVVFSCLVGSSWSQRPRDRANPPRHQQQQQKQPVAADESDLTDECPEPNGYFADGYQCDKYYECKDGAITEKLCPDGMVFNDFSILHEKCDLPFNLDCSQRSLLQDPKPSTHCPRQNGYFAHEDEKICDKFYFCVDGKFNMITCPSGLVYNEKTGICTWPDEAKKKHCSSEAEVNRVKRVAFWKSDEESSSSREASAEDGGSFYDSRSVEGERKRKTGSAEYGSGSAEYPDYGSSSAEYASDYPTYDTAYDDPEFSNFDTEFQDFADAAGTSLGSYPGFTPHDFIRRKKDSVGDLDGYIRGYVKTIGKDPQKAAMGMDTKYYERIAEEVVEKEMEEEEAQKGEMHQGNMTTSHSSIRPSLPHASRVGKPVSKSLSARVPTIRKPRPGKRTPNLPYLGPILTLRKPANGVKWTYIPKPGRQLVPPPLQAAATSVDVLGKPTVLPAVLPSTTGVQVRMPQSG